MAFVNLHSHSCYSLLDGLSRIDKMLEKAKNNGETAMAITDHGNMCGCIAFAKQADKIGIKYIIGCEFYVSSEHRSKGNKNSKAFHLCVFAMDEVGYKNLIYLNTIGYSEGLYNGRPHIDDEVLASHSEGLIVSSACVAGSIPQAVINGNYAEAKDRAAAYKEIFGDRFYLEVQNHGLPDEQKANAGIFRIAQELGIDVIATNDAHYVNKEDAIAHDMLLCMNTGAKVSDEKRFRFPNNEFYLKTEEEMRALFPNHPEVIDNTARLAERCTFKYDFGHIKQPKFPVPAPYATAYEYFEALCYEGLEKRYGTNPPQEYKDRMAYELSVIKKMGYEDYFLIVQDFINWAKDHDIPVGPGRGSGAGSICAYAVRITNIDPMRYSLLFERFLNPERISMPDFDVDFGDVERERVINYVTEKYGANRTSQIITYTTMGAKLAIKDTARVLDKPFEWGNQVTKLIPKDPHITIDKALEEVKELRQRYEAEPELREVIDLAKKVEGIPKAASRHAAGVLISDKEIVNYAPLMVDKEGNVVIQATMTELEDLGLLKFDFLGLRNLTVIANTLKFIKEAHGIDIDIDNIDDSDAAVYEMLTKGETVGIFQLESDGMQGTLSGLAPKSIEDLTALISLYRPGPMDSIPSYIKNKDNPQGVTYADPRLEPILSVTYGQLVYQEQVISLFQILGGFSLGRADIVRRAISKKKEEVLKAEMNNFIYGAKDDQGNVIACGALANGVNEDTARAIMADVTAFAAYAFNKSHAACYATIAYQTAWLKYHYPAEFFAANLTSFMSKSDTLRKNIAAVKSESDMKILPPSINVSGVGFVPDAGSIRFGLAGIKNVGASLMGEVLEERSKGGPFKSFYDFCVRMQGARMNAKAFTSLIMAGAFDWTGINRHSLYLGYEKVVKAAKAEKSVDVGQLTILDFIDGGDEFKAPPIPVYEEWPEDVKLKHEKDVTGIYMSGHPMDRCKKHIANLDAMKPAEILALQEADNLKTQKITILGAISNIEERLTKKGQKMAKFVIEDEVTEYNCLAYNNSKNATVDFIKPLLVDGMCVAAKGTLKVEDENKVSIIVDSLTAIPQDDQEGLIVETFVKTIGLKKPKPQVIEQRQIVDVKGPEIADQNKPRKGLHIRLANVEQREKVLDLVQGIKGGTNVYIYVPNEEGKLVAYSNPNITVSLRDSGSLKAIFDIAGPSGIKIF